MAYPFTYSFTIGNKAYTDKTPEETIDILNSMFRILVMQYNTDYEYFKTLYQLKNDQWAISFLTHIGGAPLISSMELRRLGVQILELKENLDKKYALLALWQFEFISGRIQQIYRALDDYNNRSISGATVAIDIFTVIKTGAQMGVTAISGTLFGPAGGAVIAGEYAALLNETTQVTEIAYHMRDKMDIGSIALDGLLTGGFTYYGGALRDSILKTSAGQTLAAKIGSEAAKKAITVAIGRASGVASSVIKSCFQAAKLIDPPITWEKFIDNLAEEFTKTNVFVEVAGSFAEGQTMGLSKF